MKFGIGVIVYNPDKYVIKRLRKYKDITDYLFVFDNSELDSQISSDIKKEFGAHYCHKNNVGMSGALNWIIKESFKKQLDYLLTMDQDSDFASESICEMLKLIQSEKDTNIAVHCPNYRKIYSDENGNEIFGDFKISNEENKDVNYSMTSASFFKVKYLSGLEPLDNLFIGYVDQDICYSLRNRGYKIRMVGSISFDQRVGQTLSGSRYNQLIKAVKHTPTRYYYMGRNNIYLREKYSDSKKIVKELKLSYYRILLNIFLSENDKAKKISAFSKGKKDAKINKLGKLQGNL